MKKRFAAAVFSTVMTIAMCTPALAGQWISDSAGWWWRNDDGSYSVNAWQWIDGNNDGTAECYYFNSSGYCLLNTSTPDGYQVNSDGAWVVDGTVQTKAVQTAAVQNTQASAAQYEDNYSGTYRVPFYEMDDTVTSQDVVVVYDQASNSVDVTFSRFGSTVRYTYAGTDFRGFTFFELMSEEEKDAIFFSAPGVIEWPSADGTESISRK